MKIGLSILSVVSRQLMCGGYCVTTPYINCLLTTDKMDMPILIKGPLVGEVFGRHLEPIYKTSTFDFMDLCGTPPSQAFL